MVVAVENKYFLFWVRVFSLSYQARKKHAPCYFVVYDLFAVLYFPHYPNNSTTFGGGGNIEHKHVFWFSLNLCLKHISF
jgi:hypothetical protein